MGSLIDSLHGSAIHVREHLTWEFQHRRRTNMRAAVFRGAFDIRVEQIPDASILESTDAIIHITHACICGTDLWPYRG